MRRALLAAGVLAPIVYVGTDIVAAQLYPGYSFADQAVSELFAIGAPTARPVAALFSLSSLLMLAFAAGAWRSGLHLMASMMLANAIDALALWIFFPLHMRGVAPTSTDTMHAVLAVNPFVLLTVVFALGEFRGWFRWYSVATIVAVLLPASFAYYQVSNFLVCEPTPWLGLAERVGQYAHQLWHAVLAFVLLDADRQGRKAAA